MYVDIEYIWILWVKFSGLLDDVDEGNQKQSSETMLGGCFYTNNHPRNEKTASFSFVCFFGLIFNGLDRMVTKSPCFTIYQPLGPLFGKFQKNDDLDVPES